MAQQAAFATGVLPDIYAFHRYTRNSACLYHSLVCQYLLQVRSRAPEFHRRLNRPPACALRPVIPNNACALRLTAAAGTELAGASSGGTVNRPRCFRDRSSSPLTVVYTPKGFLPHAASLRQSFDHCAIFPTAASRRSLGRISVPMWRVVLSDPLRVVALVSHYLTNKLIRRDPLSR